MDTKKILLVDDSPGMIQVMARVLSGVGLLHFAMTGAAALEQIRKEPPDLILLDAEMPGMSGYDVCEVIKADPALADIPVIFVTGHSEQAFELKGLEVGAVDFLTKPISEPLLLARVRTQLRVKQLTDELKRIAAVDALTETVNRRAFDAALDREWKRGLRAGDPMSILMVDVDHFKLFNDNYGHPAGDACLRSVAQALKRVVLRPADFVARYGGEEFAILLPQTPRVGAEHLAHRVLDIVESIHIPHASSPSSNHVTVSIGVSSYDSDSSGWVDPSPDSRFMSSPALSATDLVQAADKALYAAKRGGRAQAWWLDIADVDAAGLAREISPPRRAAARRAGV